MVQHSLVSIWLDGSGIGREQVGGKGLCLCRLIGLGAPVPPAFCLTTDAYRRFARTIGLPTTANAVHPDQLPEVRAAITSMALPDDLIDQLYTNFTRLAERSGGPLSTAVRSSATAEDSASTSFAGLHETILDVRNVTNLEAAVKRCWASLWTERAIDYRHQTGIAREEVTIAVVVQELVRSDVSVVVFTTDPISGRSDRLVINATWGLGESLVSGLVTPDHIVIDPSGNIVDYTVGTKAIMTVAGGPDGGTREVTVPRLLRDARALTDEQAQMIAETARNLAHRLDYAADLEGGLAADRFYVFQARPITTLDEQSVRAAGFVA